MKSLYGFLLLGLVALLCGCASSAPVCISRGTDSVRNYKYVYVAPTEGYSLSTDIGSVVTTNPATSMAMYTSSTVTQTANPSTIIKGWAIKKGYVVVYDIRPEFAEQTMIITCAETNRRSLGGGIIEMTAQCVSAKTYQIICVYSAESYGWGSEPNRVKNAVNKCMSAMFK